MRYKEFNNNRVLEKCVSLFWESGFCATSISKIVDQTNVNRYSLYNEFESKEGILIGSIKLYRERVAKGYINLLSDSGDFIEGLKKFYFSFLKDKQQPAGCYLIYISTELADCNKEVKDELIDYLGELEAEFKSLLESQKEYKDKTSIIADQLVALFCNSMCYCYIQSEEDRVKFIDLNLQLILNN